MGRFGYHSRDRTAGRFNVSLRETQQRQPGIRCSSVSACQLVGLMGGRHVTTKSIQLGERVRGRTCRAALCRQQRVASPPCLFEGFSPLAVEAQDLGTVRQALASVRHKPVLRDAPLVQRFGPGARPPDVEHFDAGGDDLNNRRRLR